MTLFDDALTLVLLEEGGRVDDARDPGGRTDQGVTQRTFDAWQDAQGLPRRDVWTIGAAEVAAIYRNRYADPIRFDALPAGVGYAVFDDAVNSGAVEAARELQLALGMTGAAVDGVVGALTVAAARKADPVVLIGRLCDGRLTFLRRLRAFVTFGRGWTNRVAFVRGKALAMAATSHAPAASVQPVGISDKLPPCTRSGCPLAKAA